MWLSKRSPAAGVVLPLGLLVLLALLAWLQYRWTGELSRAEAERMEASLRASVRRFAEDVDEELARVFETFHVADEDELLEAYVHWRRGAPRPGLVDDVYLERDATLYEVGEDGLRETAWPDELAALRDRGAPARPRRHGAARFPPFPLLSASPPAMLIPVRAPRSRWRPPPGKERVLVELSLSELREDVFPELAARSFATGESREYEVAILDASGEPIWTSAEADASAVAARPDARARLFSLSRALRRFAPRPELPPFEAGSRRGPLQEAARELFEGRWQVFVRHRAGSLGAAVSRVRARNLAVGFGILGILGVSVVLIAVSARRAVELGNRKMEFVAGVSHELRTPLAVIRSAAQNLADGSVSEPAQVKRYGDLVEGEGRRLEALVEEVLELAGIQSQRRRYRRQRVELTKLADDVVTEREALAPDEGVEIARAFPEREVFVLGDDAALRRALSNLVENAIKHGGEGGRVEVAVEERGDEVALSVSDRGPGVPEEDVTHLFEPFYRGRRARDRQISGSGLGLSLVDHIVREHGGRVEVATRPGEGSRFTILLPAEAPE